jgi:hypothetical protein
MSALESRVKSPIADFKITSCGSETFVVSSSIELDTGYSPLFGILSVAARKVMLAGLRINPESDGSFS